jgi:hypothetical protein
MIRILLVLVPLVALLSSCQKEFSADLNSRTDSTDTSGNTPNAPLLVKMVDSTGNDVYVTEFDYDAKNRLIREKITTNNLNAFVTDLQVFRNSQGIITKTTTLTTSVTWGTDFSEETYYYNPALARYTHTLSETAVTGGTMKDSSVFRYDAGGRIKEEEVYIMAAGSTTYEPIGKSAYTYDIAGNILSQSDSNRAPGTAYEWVESYIYEYDLTRKYPIYLGVESVLLNIGAKNLPKTFRVDHHEDQYDMLVTFSFIFNSDQWPVSHTTTNTLGSPGRTTYYYR